MKRRRFELTDGSSSKYWEVETAGSSLSVRYGKIGTDGQSKTKALGSVEKAEAEAEKLIRQKEKKGYAEVGSKSATKKKVAKKTATKKKATKKKVSKPAYLSNRSVQAVSNLVPEGKELPPLLGQFIAWAESLGDEAMFEDLGIEGFTAEAYEDDSLTDDVVQTVDDVTCSFVTLGEGSRLSLWWHDTGAPAVVLIDSEGQDEVLADSLERLLLNWSRRKSGVTDLDCDEDGDTRRKSDALAKWLKSEGVKAPRARKVPDFLAWREALGGPDEEPEETLAPGAVPNDMADRVVACLGLSSSEEPLKSLLEQLGIDMSRKRTTDQYRNVAVPEHGYLLKFEKPQGWASPHGDYVSGEKAACIKGKARMLVKVEFCAEGYRSWNLGTSAYDEYAGFEPPLPFGLSFEDSPAAVAKKGFEDGARYDDAFVTGVMRVDDDDEDGPIAPGTIEYVSVSLWNEEMLRRRTWLSKELLTAAIRARDPSIAETIYDGWDVRYEDTRAMVLSLDEADRTALVGLDPRCWNHFAESAWQLYGKGEREAALDLFDAVVASPRDDEPGWVGVNATFILTEKIADGEDDPERARAYLERYASLGEHNSPVLLNLALLQIHLGELDGAIATLRTSVELGDPTVGEPIESSDDLAPLRGRPGWEKLLAVTPKYPVALRRLKTALYAKDAVLVKGAAAVDVSLRGKPGKGVAKRFEGAKDKDFTVFGDAADGGLWAMWRRDPKAPVEALPIVVVRDGRMAVYAPDTQSFLALLACGYGFDDALKTGVLAGKPRKRGKAKPTSDVDKKLKARLKKVGAMDKAGAKIDPAAARTAALELTPEL